MNPSEPKRVSTNHPTPAIVGAAKRVLHLPVEAPVTLRYALAVGAVGLAVLESISDALFTLDRSWLFTYLNHQAPPHAGKTAQDLLGKRNIGMPGEDGYALIRKIREREARHGRKIPAVALTACARSEDRTRAILCGHQVHLLKPVEPHEQCVNVASLAGRTGPARATDDA